MDRSCDNCYNKYKLYDGKHCVFANIKPIENDVLLAKNNLLQEENEKLKSELRGKENEINDLKERIAYLKQFKPKEKDIPIRQG